MPSGQRWPFPLIKLALDHDLASIILLWLALSVFLLPGHGLVSVLIAELFLVSFLAGCLLLGRTVAWCLPFQIAGITEFPFLFCNGYICFSLLMVLFCFVLPAPIWVSYILTLGLAGIGQYFANWKKTRLPSVIPPRAGINSAFCVLLAAISTFEWTVPQRHMYMTKDGGLIFPLWVDSFFHMGLIATFSESKNCFDLHNAWLAGTRLPVYHYAGYMPAAMLRHLADFLPIDVYCQFYVPLGIMITILAGYSFARQWWNADAALVAACSILLIPDASWQGLVKNHVFSFDWLIVAMPVLGVGIALLTLAWSIMMQACLLGNRNGLILAYICAGFVALFKIQLFVGNALLLWFFPVFFFKGVSRSGRCLWFVLGAVVFGGGWYLESQTSLPRIIVNGTGGIEVMNFMNNLHIGGFTLKRGHTISFVDYLLAALYLYIAILGWWALLWVLLSRAKSIFKPLGFTRFVPALIMGNYVLMYLLLDDTGANYNEFLHRPFVWAYFAVVSFTSAGLYNYSIEKLPSRRGLVNSLTALIFAVCLLLSASINYKIVNPFRIGGLTDFTMPSGLKDCALFVSKQSRSGDVVQSADLDPNLLLQAFVGRREWLSTLYISGSYAGSRDSGRITRQVDSIRLDQWTKWMAMTDKQQIENFARQEKIRWLITNPLTPPAWSRLVADHVVFEVPGYNVVKFF